MGLKLTNLRLRVTCTTTEPARRPDFSSLYQQRRLSPWGQNVGPASPDCSNEVKAGSRSLRLSVCLSISVYPKGSLSGNRHFQNRAIAMTDQIGAAEMEYWEKS